ncbi:MAG: YihY family inner membrane protein [Aquincola tertiaricarbonis]|uniref:YihY family inner membrane protein n=1 Tax=Aquincola sp. J276 TaxID=2898432 RepID=UPI0038572490
MPPVTLERRPWRHRALSALMRLRSWPWLDTLRTLRDRFREDRLGLTASSLTFTTLIALVPLVTVMLALFSAFPIFSSFQVSLERYFLQTLVPDNIAKPVLTAVTQFARQATKLGTLGLVVLLLTALALMLTIDRTLNTIWRVRRPRPIAQRVLVYWAAITLGPLVLGVSLSMTSYAISASRGLVGAMPDTVNFLLNLLEFSLQAAAVTGLFHYVPNTDVRWRHALAGGLFCAVGFEVAKKVLGWYVGLVPTYSTVYGAFATLPILLLWMYIGWVIVLLGAVIAAYAPSLSMRIVRRVAVPGHQFSLAIGALRLLSEAHGGRRHGLTLRQLAEALSTDPLLVESVIDALVDLDWVGRLEEEGGQRHVLLVDPQRTPLQPLLDELLLVPDPATRAFRQKVGVEALRLEEVL